ncbi:hypothetical protein TAMYLO_480011 [Tenacibaculum amylolyticum]
MLITIQIFLAFLALYFGIGFLFGLYFIFKAAPKIDPLISHSKKSVRLLLFPGAIAMWPFLVLKLFKN